MPIVYCVEQDNKEMYMAFMAPENLPDGVSGKFSFVLCLEVHNILLSRMLSESPRKQHTFLLHAF